MDTYFSTEFASTENQFIYSDGVNRGHSLSYSKINRCVFISSDAKQLYHNISDYAYGGKRDCFPSHQSLMIELGWGNTKLKECIKELRDTGLIDTKNTPGKPTVYRLNELHKVHILQHSELIYYVMVQLKSQNKFNPTKFRKKLEQYKKSTLLEEVGSTKTPVEYRDRILDYFTDKEDSIGNKKEDKAETKEKPKEKARLRGTRVPVIVEDTSKLDREPLEGSKKRKKTSRGLVQKGLNSFDEQSNRADLSDPVHKWSFLHLFKYFNLKYQEVLGEHPMTTVADGVNLKRVMKVKEPQVIKQDIDNYLTLECFSGRNLRGMCSGYVQSVLNEYSSTGKLPTYKPKSQVTINKDSNFEEWENSLDDILE